MREQLKCHENVRYGDGNRETMDLFPSQSSKWLVFIHGGYWRSMTKGFFSFLAEPFVKEGISVAVLEYDLCPAVSVDKIISQCRSAISWLYQHAGAYGMRCDELIIAGHSAGGHLTAMMFATDWTQHSVPPEAIIGGVAISGLFDLDPIRQTAMNTDLQLEPNDVLVSSPARLKPAINVPLALVVGGRESSEFHRQCRILKGAPGWETVTATDVVVKTECNHFDILEVLLDLDSDLWSSVPLRALIPVNIQDG